MADIVFPGATAGGPLGSDYLPSNYDLVLYRGDYFSMNITVKDNAGTPINLTGYTAKSQIRTSYDAVSAYDATCTITDPTNGKVSITFPSSVMTTVTPGDYIWDFQVTQPDGNVRTFLAGDVKVYGEVTK